MRQEGASAAEDRSTLDACAAPDKTSRRSAQLGAREIKFGNAVSETACISEYKVSFELVLLFLGSAVIHFGSSGYSRVRRLTKSNDNSCGRRDIARHPMMELTGDFKAIEP